jgi:hypothetical protein
VEVGRNEMHLILRITHPKLQIQAVSPRMSGALKLADTGGVPPQPGAARTPGASY